MCSNIVRFVFLFSFDWFDFLFFEQNDLIIYSWNWWSVTVEWILIFVSLLTGFDHYHHHHDVCGWYRFLLWLGNWWYRSFISHTKIWSNQCGEKNKFIPSLITHTHTQNNHIIYTFFLLVLPLFICWTKLMKFLIKKKENQINHHHRSMIKLIFIDWLWLIEKNDVFLNYNGNKKKKKLAAKSIKKSCCYCCCW